MPLNSTSTKVSGWLEGESSKPIYDQIKSAIRQRVLSGELPRGQRLPAIRELCTRLDVSYATVARSVRDLVKEGVLESSTTEGTRVALRRCTRSQTIGVIGPFSFPDLVERSRYFERLLPLLLHHIANHERTALYAHWRPGTSLTSMFQELSLIDALIVLAPDERQQDELQAVRRIGVPLVCAGKTFGIDVPTIDSANTSDAFRAVRMLIERGHRWIACLGEEHLLHSEPGRMRVDGYTRALSAAGLPDDPAWIIAADPVQQATALRNLSPLPTAAFFAGGVAHLAKTFATLKDSPLRPGDNLALCIYDEDLWQTVQPLGIEFWRVEQPMEAIATQSVDLVTRMLEDHDFNPGHLELPSRLVHVHSRGAEELTGGEQEA